MGIQTPGLAISLYVMIAIKVIWVAWIATIISLVLHIILLYLLVYYYILEKRPTVVYDEESGN